MKIFNGALIFILLFVLGCKSDKKDKVEELQEETHRKNYILVADDDDILVEEFDSTVVDINKYNSNNHIYKVGRVFNYDFKHISPDNEVKFFRILVAEQDWEFVNEEEADSSTVQSVIIKVLDGNPLAEHFPEYNQTNLRYIIDKSYGFSNSGAIENEGNVWIHPPRSKYFEILELNPFPYIKTPYEIGNSWTWSLKIGAGWADERWKVWEGQIENRYVYEIISKETVKTPIGSLECFVIEGTAQSRIGSTHLTSYFNIDYGFVKLDYTNIDSSKTILELVEVSD